MIPLTNLRTHMGTCSDTTTIPGDEFDDGLPSPPRKKTEQYKYLYASLHVEGVCPVCNKFVKLEVLEAHASTCGEITPLPQQQDFHNMTITEELNAKLEKMVGDELWFIRIIRRSFLTTTLEQLEEPDDSDWGRSLRVEFIGEEGIDAGGLSREFFSVLFKATEVFEGNNFSVKPKLLDEKQYRLLGKAVATAILHGHPGPRCFNRHVTTYILTGEEPNFREVANKDIWRADAFTAIEKTEEASSETIGDVFMDQISVLEATGYTSKLSFEGKDKAITSSKAHFLLYRVMASINQFIEAILQNHPKEAESFLCEDSIPKAEDVLSFYKPNYSDDEQEKAKEEVIMYNWSKFLKKVERGKVTTTWINPEDGKDDEVELNMEHVLQALLGC